MRPLSGYYPTLQEVFAHMYENWCMGKEFERLTGHWPVVVMPPFEFPGGPQQEGSKR